MRSFEFLPHCNEFGSVVGVEAFQLIDIPAQEVPDSSLDLIHAAFIGVVSVQLLGRLVIHNQRITVVGLFSPSVQKVKTQFFPKFLGELFSIFVDRFCISPPLFGNPALFTVGILGRCVR